MAEKLRLRLSLWGPPPSSTAEMEARIRRVLRVTRSEGFRLVRDPWGNRVRVSLDHILGHVAGSRDITRWFFIPAIIPTIKAADSCYWRAPDDAKGEREDTYTYEATHEVRWPSEPRGVSKPMTFFLPSGPEDSPQVGGSPDELSRRRYMRTIYPAGNAGRVRTARKRAGVLLTTRPNPSESTYIGTRDPGGPSQAAQCLPGAAPALHLDNNSNHGDVSSRIGRFALLATGILALRGLALRAEQGT